MKPNVPAVFAALEEKARGWGVCVCGGVSHNEVSALHSLLFFSCMCCHGNNQDCRGNRPFRSSVCAAAQSETPTVGDNVNTATSAHPLCGKVRAVHRRSSCTAFSQGYKQ